MIPHGCTYMNTSAATLPHLYNDYNWQEEGSEYQSWLVVDGIYGTSWL
jgi:hypothetical protein